MKTVITYGTFDLFHVGHLKLLERARALGDRLVVGVSTDAFNEGKGKRTAIPYADRAAIVRAIRFVDDVIPEAVEGSLQLAAHVLEGLGFEEDTIEMRIDEERERAKTMHDTD